MATVSAESGEGKPLHDAALSRPILQDEMLGRAAVLLRGTPGSPGVVDGPVRIIRHVAESGKLGSGEVLVAPFTNPAWTPLFQRPPPWSSTAEALHARGGHGPRIRDPRGDGHGRRHPTSIGRPVGPSGRHPGRGAAAQPSRRTGRDRPHLPRTVFRYARGSCVRKAPAALTLGALLVDQDVRCSWSMSPRQSPVSRPPRSSMNSLKRSRSPSTRRSVMFSASAAFSRQSSGSYSKAR